MDKVYFHGELVIREIAEIPAGAKAVGTREDIKLADSETTGNHHMLKVIPGVHVYSEDMERFYVRPEVDTKIYCALESRHTDLPLKALHSYEIVPAQEYDHIQQHTRKVLD